MIELYNVHGQLIRKEFAGGSEMEISIELAQLEKGIYFLKITGVVFQYETKFIKKYRQLYQYDLLHLRETEI